MVRRQVQFTERELAAVQTLARERSSSFAAIVREAVDAYLQDALHGDSVTRTADRLDALAGKYRSGRDDISRRHDDYLADAIPEGLDAE
ncbi:MAG: CopG family transcriptional regulator [Actinobacteria bacterium]|nr:CopG family transcriptional regulator [Actinomycetota bacterium]